MLYISEMTEESEALKPRLSLRVQWTGQPASQPASRWIVVELVADSSGSCSLFVPGLWSILISDLEKGFSWFV